MLPANEARSDLNSIRGQTGVTSPLGKFTGKMLNMKRVGSNLPGSRSDGFTPGQPDRQPMTAPGMTGVNRVAPTSMGTNVTPWAAHAPQAAPASMGAPAPAPPPIPTPSPGITQQLQAGGGLLANAVPGAPTPISSFGPGNDLLSSQINPGNSGVNRTQLAQNQLASWDAQDQPRMAGEMRQVGQNAAKFGRIGAGMTTNDLTGIEATHNRDRMSFANDLASGLASDTVNDARANNNELRTERDYQTGRSDKAQQDQINRKVLEDQLLNSRFGRAQGMMGAGYANDPTGILGQQAENYGQQSAGAVQGGIDLLRNRQPQQSPPDYTELLKQLLQQQGGG